MIIIGGISVKRKLIFILSVVFVLGIASVSFAEAPEDSLLVEDFSDATVESLAEYWRPDFSYVELNTDAQFAKTGGASLKMVKDCSHHRQANVLLNSKHPNWKLLSEKYKLGFWVYIDDYENLYENEWGLFLATHSQGEWKDAILNIKQEQLEPGWNWVETYIMFDETIDELMFGFNYYGEVEVPTYIDEIRVW